MKINIILHSSIIKHAGTHNGYSYDHLKFKYNSGHRLYLVAIKNNIPMTEVVKVMKLDSGKIYLSFGKNKIEIGTYEEVAA